MKKLILAIIYIFMMLFVIVQPHILNTPTMFFISGCFIGHMAVFAYLKAIEEK